MWSPAATKRLIRNPLMRQIGDSEEVHRQIAGQFQLGSEAPADVRITARTNMDNA